MTNPSPKQIEFAQQLGIPYPQNYTKEALSQIINDKLGKPTQSPMSNAPRFPPRAPEGAAQHDIVIQRTEKPHSYEFGKPSARHKIYYGEVEELFAHIEKLRTAGLIEQQDFSEPQNVQ